GTEGPKPAPRVARQKACLSAVRIGSYTQVSSVARSSKVQAEQRSDSSLPLAHQSVGPRLPPLVTRTTAAGGRRRRVRPLGNRRPSSGTQNPAKPCTS